jgi:hypothetical protein
MTNLNKNDGKKLQKIKNFNNYEFDFGSVIQFGFPVDNTDDEDKISLQLHIVATNLETKDEKILAFNNGGSGYNDFEQETWDLYADGCENVLVGVGFNNMDDNDNDLIKYLIEYLNEYNYASDYSVDDVIN